MTHRSTPVVPSTTLVSRNKEPHHQPVFTTIQTPENARRLISTAPAATTTTLCPASIVNCSAHDVSSKKRVHKKQLRAYLHFSFQLQILTHLNFSVQCDRGNPLRIGEVTQSCQSNADCPSSHECKIDQGVCCPRMRKNPFSNTKFRKNI